MAESDQRKQSITYGSIISISHIHDDDALVAGDGFIKRSVTLKGMSPFVRSHSKKFTTDQFSQFQISNCLFMVFPEFQNNKKKEILEKVPQLDHEGLMMAQKEEDQVEPLTASPAKYSKAVKLDEVTIRRLQESLLSEYKYNIESFDKEKSLEVTYDQPIQLLHIASSKFLAFSQKEAKFENQNFKLSLDYYPSEATLFKIVAAFKYQRDGNQKIYASEVVRIIRSIPLLNKVTYMHCSGELIDVKKDVFKVEKKRQDFGGQMKIQKREVNASLEESASWKINLFSEYIPQNSKLLKIGDTLWLHHSEFNATLAATRQSKAFDRMSFDSFNLKEWLSLENVVVSVQPSDKSDSTLEQYRGNTYSMWIVEGEDYQDGGLIQYERNYRLKHFCSGLYLGIARPHVEPVVQTQVLKDPFQVTQQQKRTMPVSLKEPAKFVLLNVPDRHTLFEFIALKQSDLDERFIKQGSFIYLKNVVNSKYVDIVSRIDGIKPNGHQHLQASQLKPTIKNEKEKSEQTVFKLYRANAAETWEIMFLESCNKILLKLLHYISGFYLKGDASDFDYLKIMEKKLSNSVRTITELNDFLNNKVYNSTPEQKYGSLSSSRQTLLRQQYFIDILIKILQESVTKNELEMWDQRGNLLQQDHSKQETDSIQKRRQLKTVTQREILEYIIKKVNMCSEIYTLLISVTKNNNENQLYIYDLLPYFQIHTKYIPEAVSFLIHLVQNNMTLLSKLSQNLRIEFNYTTQQIVQEDMSKKVKILINLYESTQKPTPQNDQIAFKTHEKITQKPLNLINFFFNVLWDENSSNKVSYLRFLSSICRYKDHGVQINQENLFKLYKQFNEHTGMKIMGIQTDQQPLFWDGYLNMIKNELQNPSDYDKNQKQFITEQLHFFAEVSYGRNYIWKHELLRQFPQVFLFKNIWKKQSNPFLKELKHLWCKMSMSLYINHQPLKKIVLPNYCRLFRNCIKPRDHNLFNREAKLVFSHPDDFSFDDDVYDRNLFEDTYRDFIKDLLNYLQDLKQIVVKQVERCGNDNDKDNDKIGKDVLNDKLILSTSELLLLLLQLDIFELVDASKTDDCYMRIIDPIIHLIQYDRKNLKYINASSRSINENVDKNRQRKADKPIMLNIPFNPMDLGKLIIAPKAKTEESEQKDDFNEAQESDDHQIFTHVIMRGFISLNNHLDALTYEENCKIKMEIDIKLNVCSILEHFLDRRQNFLISNILVFFRKKVLKEGNFAEDKEDKVLENDNNNVPEIKTKQIEQIDKYLLGLIPNIARTGIHKIDEPHKQAISSLNFNLKPGDIMNDALGFLTMSSNSKDKPESFTNYFKQFKIEGFNESYDLDQYLSLMADDISVGLEPIASILPYLLGTFFYVHDELLEERCLNVTMRVFNQREELRSSLKKVQMLFDDEKSQLFEFIEREMKTLTKLIERSEIWLSEFVRDDRSVSSQMQHCCQIIGNLEQGFYKNLIFEGNTICQKGSEYQNNQIDPLKQSVMNFLQVHTSIIQLIKNGFHYLVEVMLVKKFAEEKKIIICKLFTVAYKFLQSFVKGNNSNQLMLYEDLETFQQYIQFDVGQCELISEIFRDNFILLSTRVDYSLLNSIILKIDNEGRQQNFINLVSVLLKCKGKYIFNNQLLILNTFLPLRSLTDQEIKVLYADGMKGKQVQFNLYDTLYDKRDDLISQLKDVDWNDTYRDEPFRYHAALLDMLIQTTLIQANRRMYDPQDSDLNYRDNFNIGVIKLKQMIPADTILEMLKQPDNMIHEDNINTKHGQDNINTKHGYVLLKLQLCEFLRLVHITSDKRLPQMTEMYQLSQEMSQLLELEGHRLDLIGAGSHFDKVSYIPYLIEGLLPLMISYSERILMHHANHSTAQTLINFTSKLANCLEVKLHEFFDTKRQNLIIKQFLSKYRNPILDKIMMDRFQDHGSYCDLPIDFSQNQKELPENKNELNVEQKCSLQKLFIMQPSPQQQKDFYSRDLFGGSIFGLNKSADRKCKDYSILDDLNKEDLLDIEFQWKEFVSTLIESKLFEKEIELEKQVLADAIINVESLLSNEFSKGLEMKPNIDMVIKKFINFLQYAIKQPKNKDTVVTLLKIMRKIIEKEEDQKKRVELQNHFDKLGATKMILLVISQHSKSLNPEMLLSLLHFANTMLSGGNRRVQKTIYNFCLTYEQSETIFQTFAKIIKHQIVNLDVRAKERKQTHNSSVQANASSQSENDDEEEEEEEELEDQDSNHYEVILNQVLQFIQNCALGHYQDLQNYFRFQTNSRTTYDMIDLIADLLKTYYYEERTVGMYDNMINCLEALNQLVQGPCYDNQVAVVESKFIDIVSDLFPHDKQLQEKQQPKAKRVSTMQRQKINIQEPIKPWMVAHLQNKVLVLVLSLLEMREMKGKNSMIKRIMRTLPIKVLERHMLKVYRKFNKIYGEHYLMDSLDHISVDPRDPSESDTKQITAHPKYSETVIQNGFYMFSLICQYLKSEESLDSHLVNMHKTYLKTVILRDVNGLLSPNSTLGQIIALVLDLIDQSLQLAQAVSNATLGKLKGRIPDDEFKQMKQKQKMEDRKLRLKKAFKFFMSNTAHIEIVRDDKLEIVFFPLLPYCRCLPKDQKQIFEEEVDRSSTKAKVQYLISQSDEIIEIMIHEEIMKIFYRQNKVIGFFANYQQLWKDVAFYLTLILNLFIIASFAISNEDGEVDGPNDDRLTQFIFFRRDDWTQQQTQSIFLVLGIAMTCCSLFVVIFFLAKIAPLIIQRALRQEPLIDTEKPGIFTRLINLVYRLLYIFFSCLANFEVLYYIAYGLMAILGTTVHPFFYAFHLTVVLIRYPLLNNVIKSITEPKESLILTLVLLLILSYVYTLVAYLLLQDIYKGNCHQVLYCFLYAFDWNLKVPGGVGGFLSIDDNVPTYYPARYISDSIENLIIVIIMTSIVLGIIIDTFGSLRKQEDNKKSDIQDKCFMCGLENDVFEKQSNGSTGGFQNHIRVDHYMWNYLYYIAYINWKNPQNHSGIESFVFHKLKVNDLSWIPFNKAIELADKNDNESEIERRKVTNINQEMLLLVENGKQILKNLRLEKD